MAQNLEDLYRWIDEHQITRHKKNLNRDFSDAVPLAEILKKHYPKIVDMHNYAPKNSLALKIANWEILNRKVLNKIKINLSQKDQVELAKCIPGAIEKLLLRIKTKVEKKSEENKIEPVNERVYFLEGISNQERHEEVVPIKIRAGSKTLDQKMVPVNIFDRMEQDIASKNEKIAMLQDKLEHLEKMVAIKDERIKDLSQQLQAVGSGTGDTSATPRARFFNKIF
ncbi:sperm flagellar protein 1-like [Sitophilus oryzae]|uniref:Sperm flagellar protein 1-like n=1 Tax=Sitophilus oryzae TaxID=7048 RepID=A0A6J2Y561_SITOR|nr:sperm flagellar protein 1-like [Sitophilus oryzae]